jgi:hypothetical protein
MFMEQINCLAALACGVADLVLLLMMSIIVSLWR